MSVFSRETFSKPISMEKAWHLIMTAKTKRVQESYLFPHPSSNSLHSLIAFLNPEGFEASIIIIWLERFRQYALAHGGKLTILNPYKDFQEYNQKRRPDPSQGEWLWLYTQIVERQCNVLEFFSKTVQIMGGRDALLPLLESLPDKELFDLYQKIKSPWQINVPAPAISYHDLEAAIQEDAPEKVVIIKTFCRHVTDDEILKRAIASGKGAVVATMLRGAPVDRIVEVLIMAHTNWENPTPLFERLLPQYEDEIAAWRDPWGNAFFWYLYRRPSLSLDIIKSLPPKVFATIELKNRYGISPKDLWCFYRPSLISTRPDQCI